MEYNEYSPRYQQRVIELLNICFQNKNVTKKSFIWKHFDPIFCGKSIGMVAVDRGNVCSFVCFTPLTITDKKKVCKNIYSCAVQATHPHYRRKGIVSHLTEIIESKLNSRPIDYIGFSNTDGLKIDLFSKRINYKIIGQMATQYVPSFISIDTSLDVKRVKRIPSSFIHYAPYYCIKKNADYIRWRYVNNPKTEFIIFEICDKNTSVGFIICIDGYLKYSVVDILAKNFDSKILSKIVKAFSYYAIKNGKPFISYSYLQNSFWDGIFPFFSIRRLLPIYVTFKTAKHIMLQKENWIIQEGDIQ